MSGPLMIPVCDACGTACWPPRIRCASCGGAGWSPTDGSAGAVEQTTDLPGQSLRLATVRLDAGPVVIARGADARAGDRVMVVCDDTGALDAALRQPDVER